MPISPMTKSASIYQELKRKILEGLLEPGTHLIIKQIAAEYGISDIPVREALKELNMEGLVETTPHVGSRVASFSQKNIKDMLEMRECLEPFAAELAVENSNPEIIAQLEKYYNDSLLALDQKNILKYGELNKAFHRLIIESSGNQKLVDTIFEMMESEKRMRMIFQMFPEVLSDSSKEHAEMLIYMKENNRDAMRKLMYQHKKRSFDKMRKFFKIL
jgi:DNA-binding GntR family transcriptional regulator